MPAIKTVSEIKWNETSEKSNLVIFANHIFSAYILHKAKIQNYVIVFVIERK